MLDSCVRTHRGYENVRGATRRGRGSKSSFFCVRNIWMAPKYDCIQKIDTHGHYGRWESPEQRRVPQLVNYKY